MSETKRMQESEFEELRNRVRAFGPVRDAADVTDEVLRRRDVSAFNEGFAAGLECSQERIAAADEMAKALTEFYQYYESDFIRVTANDGRTLSAQMTWMHSALAAYNALK